MTQELLSSAISRRTLFKTGMQSGLAAALASTTSLLPSALLQAQGSSNYLPSIVVQWNALLLQAIRENPTLGPTIVARALAIVHTAIYDAWSLYTDYARPTLPYALARRPFFERTLPNKQEAISYAAYHMLTDLYPLQEPLFHALMDRYSYSLTVSSSPSSMARTVGETVAQTLLAFRHHDGSNQLGDLHPGPYSDYTGYIPVNPPAQPVRDLNQWQPLQVPDGMGHINTQHFTTPHWGKVIPFSMPQDDLVPLPHAPLTVAQQPSFEEQAREILLLSAALGDREKVIAEYWKDGPHSEQPPGHWCLFAQYVSRRDRHTLDQDVQLFFILTNALFDASICCWHIKRAYDSVRPITAIHTLFAGTKVLAWAGPFQGTRWIDGAQWQPYQPATIVTPPFPEFCSGHSTFSAACAEVLRRFTGSDHFGAVYLIKRGSSVIEPGLVPATNILLSWSTFTEAANQAGISRRYGGIHFKTGDLMGRELGRIVGGLVWEKAQYYLRVTSQ